MATYQSPPPDNLILHRQSKMLELVYGDDNYQLPAEYLRVYSPSAEVQGHGPDQAILQVGKEDVSIDQLEPVGHYAVKIYFDDGHDTGLYTWSYLYTLAVEYQQRWQADLDDLAAAGQQRQR